MANRSFDRNIFGRKVNTPKKTVREPIEPTAVSAMSEITAICENALSASFKEDEVKSGFRHIMMVLGKEDGVSQLHIAKETNLKPSTISIALKKMEKDGYITRVNDSKDMRMSRVFLTEKGLEIANRAYQTSGDVEKVLLDGISEDDLAVVMGVIARMKENFANSDFAKVNE